MSETGPGIEAGLEKPGFVCGYQLQPGQEVAYSLAHLVSKPPVALGQPFIFLPQVKHQTGCIMGSDELRHNITAGGQNSLRKNTQNSGNFHQQSAAFAQPGL